MANNNVSTLILALSTFSELDVRAVHVGKSNPKVYQVYYKTDGVNRVMLVPRKCDDIEALQREVSILLSRTPDQQIECGQKDGPFNYGND